MPPDWCHVYFAPSDMFRPSHLRLLSPQELARRQQFRRQIDADLFGLATVMVKLAVATCLGRPPEQVDIDRTCPTCSRPHGRPRLHGSGLEVSISHSGNFAAVALTPGAPVGIDIEQMSSIDTGSLLPYVLDQTELDGVRDANDFYVSWTRKESIAKALGRGVMNGLNDIVVTAPSEAPRLLALDFAAPPAARMRDVAPAADYAGAVTVLTSGDVTVDVRDEAGMLGT